MSIFLGIIISIFFILLPFIKGILPIRTNMIKNWTWKNTFFALLLTALGTTVLDSINIARESKQYYVLNKYNGSRSAVFKPGLFVTMPFVSTVKEWDKFVEVKAVPVDSAGNITGTEEELEALKEVEGVIAGGVDVRFTDKVTATIYPSARFQMPNDEKSFISLVETYRTQDNLVMNTIVPTIHEQLKNITFMFTADEYVSGGATIYRAEIEDVLKNGSYVFSKEVIRDTIYTEPALNDTSSVVNRKRDIREIKVIEKNKKVYRDGIPLRKNHEITDNKIITAQVIINNIDLDETYEKKLSEQRDLSAQTIIENQKIITAKAAQDRIIAEGERDKASERVKQEKAQVSRLIEIETKVKEEESKRQLAEINVKTEELKAKATKISADAESYKNAKLVQAGLTPKEKAEFELKKADVVSKNISGMSVPTNVIVGGNGNGNVTESLLQTKLINDIIGK